MYKVLKYNQEHYGASQANLKDKIVDDGIVETVAHVQRVIEGSNDRGVLESTAVTTSPVPDTATATGTPSPSDERAEEEVDDGDEPCPGDA